MTTTVDASVREQALDPGGSFIVQAPAGSGKTELLIQRYLTLLSRVQEPEEIVAITFTIKAAGEMRERVLDALRRAAAGESSADEVEGRRLELARRAIDNDRLRDWGLVDHPARLQIQTIDALCLSLARQLPFLSGFAAPSGIVEDPIAVYRKAAAETIKLLGGRDAGWNQALEMFLVHVDNDVGRAIGLIADMLASRDQWLRHIGDGRAESGELESAWRGVVDAHLRRASVLFPDALKAQAAACADFAADQIGPEGVPDAAAWLNGDGFPGDGLEALGRWRFLADMLMKRGVPHWRAQVNVRQGFPPKSAAKKRMQALLASLPDDGALAEALDAIRSLPEPRLDPQQAEILNAMMIVLRLAVAQLRLVFEESGRVDFVEVTERAIAALGAMEDPSELALKLDYRIGHLLVDEFQDTSIAQYYLLRLLTQGWSPDDGRTLFLVGDPMQSIYRFREAEVGVFLKVREAGIGAVPLRPLVLRSNFRSVPAVVGWVNRAFGDVFPIEADPQAGAVAYAASTPERAESGPGDGVHVYPFVDCPPPRQAARLAVAIGEALARSGDVAVLVRARPQLKALLPALQARGIPYTGMDITALIDEPVVRDLHSLTRALLHPGDRMAWLSTLRAPWCGLVLADLLAVARPRSTIWQALRDPDVRAGISVDGLDRIDRFLQALEGAMAQRGRVNLRQWVHRAWVDLGGPALTDERGLGHARSYLDLVEKHQSGMHLGDEPAFGEALEKHWAHAEPRPGAVQLMTIHRAKGLEFDEVFLPSLERAEPTDDKRLLLWEELTGDGGLLMSTLSARGEPEGAHYRFLRELQFRKAANETDRLLYVACTRARRRLHLSANLTSREGAPSPPRRASLLGRIWAHVEPEFAACEPGEAGDQRDEPPGDPPGQALRRMSADWAPPPFPDAPTASAPSPVAERQVEFSWVGETARLVGILVHELLQRIAEEGLDRWDEARVLEMLPGWRRYLGHIGVPSEELDAALGRTADSIRNLLKDPRARWLLRIDHRDAANEHELSVAEAGRVRRLRIDRTFVDGQGVRWIVDYKTSTHEGGAREAFLDEEARRYRPQMEAYANAFRSLGAEEIRLGLYFPLLMGWREWQYTEDGGRGPV